MKLETLEKNNKKKILIGGLVVLGLVSVISFTTSRAKYKNTQSIKLANGTVNYKSSDVQLVAINVSEDGTNYTGSNTIPESGYVFNSEKSKCRIPTDTLTGENAPVAEGISIEYTDDKINVLGLTTRNTKCYLYFDKKQSTPIEDTLAKLDIKDYKTDVPNFTQIATSDEGIYETDDPMYKTTENPNPKTYYWRGAASTNYVKFANKCWRIVRINGDGTIRLIYDGTTCHANETKTADNIAVSNQVYNSLYDNSSYVGWTYTKGKQRPSDTDSTNVGDPSGIKTATESWFNNNNFTEAQREQVAEGKFCNDRRTQDNATWVQNGSTTQNYAASARIFEGTKTPSLECLAGDVYVLKTGAITADEVQFAGASGGTPNNNYYLYNGQCYWTMTPSYWFGDTDTTNMFVVNTNGRIDYYVVVSTFGLRPVINLKADITISSGNGTFDTPYIVN